MVKTVRESGTVGDRCMAEILDVNVSKCCEGVYGDSLHCDLIGCAVFTALVLMEAHGFKARDQLPGFWGNV